MKHLFLLFVLLLVGLGTSVAQNQTELTDDKHTPDSSQLVDYTIPEFVVYTDKKPMSLGVESCYTLELDDINAKKLKAYWDAFMKKLGSKGKKVKGNKYELKYKDVSIYDLSYDKLDIHRIIFEKNNDAELSIWLKNEDGFLSPTKDDEQTEKIKNFLKDFGLFVEKQKIREELLAEEKTLDILKTKHNKLINQNNKLENKIQIWEKNIAQAKEKIEKNNRLQVENEQQQVHQKEVIRIVKQKMSKF